MSWNSGSKTKLTPTARAQRLVGLAQARAAERQAQRLARLGAEGETGERAFARLELDISTVEAAMPARRMVSSRSMSCASVDAGPQVVREAQLVERLLEQAARLEPAGRRDVILGSRRRARSSILLVREVVRVAP